MGKRVVPLPTLRRCLPGDVVPTARRCQQLAKFRCGGLVDADEQAGCFGGHKHVCRRRHTAARNSRVTILCTAQIAPLTVIFLVVFYHD
eukprot:SAG22_NODE_7109_length_775_cov_1.102071_1_plen_89_part_00